METMQAQAVPMVAMVADVADGARRSHEAVSAFLAGGGVVSVLPPEAVAARPVRPVTEEERHALEMARLCM